MAEQLGPLLGVGDRAPDFDLPAADREGRISLSDYYRREPVLLLLVRGSLLCLLPAAHQPTQIELRSASGRRDTGAGRIRWASVGSCATCPGQNHC
jgi:hypothetical protein